MTGAVGGNDGDNGKPAPTELPHEPGVAPASNAPLGPFGETDRNIRRFLPFAWTVALVQMANEIDRYRSTQTVEQPDSPTLPP